MEESKLATALTVRSAADKLPPLPSVAPWLVIPYEKGMKQQAFYNPCELLKKRSCRKFVPELNGKVFWQKPSHGGWLVMLCHNKKHVYGEKNSLPSNSKFGDCFLWNPVTLKIIRLPSLLHWITSKYYAVDCTLSFPLSKSLGDAFSIDHSTIFFVFASNDRLDGVPLEHVLVYCCPGDHQWRKQQLNDKNSFDPSRFHSLHSVQGKLYALYLNMWHLEIEKQHDQTLTMRQFHIQKDTVSTDIRGRHSYTHYIESNNEVYGVWMNLSGDAKVTSLQIRKLDFELMVWTKVKSLGDNVLFIGNSTTASCSAAKMGLKMGCLFYVLRDDQSLYVHNVENDCTKCILPFNLTGVWFSPDWIMMPMIGTNEIGAVASPQQSRSYGDLMALIDVVENSLSPVDYIHFRSLCKASQAKMPAASWRLSSTKTKKDACLSPWLVFLKDDGTVLNFVNPMDNNAKYFINCSVTGATIRCSKDGWLLMSKGENDMFFYNPFTRDMIQLPDLPAQDLTFRGFSFSSLPTCRDCIVFAIRWHDELYDGHKTIYTTRRGYDNWRRINDLPSDIDLPRYLLIDNLLFLSHEFSWTNYSRVSLKQFRKFGYAFYLVSGDENIFLVQIQHPLGKLIGVYEFDLLKEKWVGVKTLGKYMLFVSNTSGFSAIVPPYSHMENKIYFPMFHGKGIIYYSLDTAMYHATCSECTCDDYTSACEYMNTSWIKPNWCPSTDQELDWMSLS